MLISLRKLLKTPDLIQNLLLLSKETGQFNMLCESIISSIFEGLNNEGINELVDFLERVMDKFQEGNQAPVLSKLSEALENPEKLS